jgi:hypothetical protein
MKTREIIEKVLRSIGLLIVSASLLSLASCAPALGSSEQGDTGSLSISIPAVASWISAASSKSGAKALGRCTSAYVEIRNSSNAVVASATQNMSTSNTIGGTGTTTVNRIPVGSDYTVQLSIFNSNVSNSVPTLIGNASGISIAKNESSAVTITCLPNNPEAISLPYASTASLVSFGEKWYSMQVTSGTTYYFVQDNSSLAIAVFDGTGALKTNGGTYLTYSPTASETIYLCIASCESSSPSCTFGVTTTEPKLSEGSAAAPVSIALDSSRVFKVGPYRSSNPSSYYAFTTDAEGDYAIDIPGGASQFTCTLYANSGFTGNTIPLSNYNSQTGCKFYGLAASTQYYLLITNYSSSTVSASGYIMSPVTIAAAVSYNEGTLASPIDLALDSSHSSSVGYHGYDCTSVYRFTTGAGPDYSISLGGLSSGDYIYVCIYSDSQLKTPTTGFSLRTSTSKWDLFLTSTTTYYLTLSNTRAGGTALPFTLTLSPVSEPGYSELLADGSWATGSVSEGSSSWFKATVAPETTYTLYMDNGNAGSGSYTAYCAAGAYAQDRQTGYLNYAYSLYSSGGTINVQSGQTTVYVRIFNGSGTFAVRLVKN